MRDDILMIPRNDEFGLSPRRLRLLFALTSLSVALGIGAERAVAQTLDPVTYSIPLSELSGQRSLPLRGVNGQNGLDFSPRRDQAVVGARVNLDYAYSPALLPDLSHLKVLLNGEVAGSIALPKQASAQPMKATVDLPVQALNAYNRLDVQLIGHYTLSCEDPLHSSLWADVAGRSTLELTVQPIVLPDDLALLPTPFFDSRDIRQLNLPFVLGNQTDPSRLESAGIVASWFGALAGYRGANFSSLDQVVPTKGNAVVLALAGDQIAGLTLPEVQGPTLAVVANPHDRYGKLLLVMGRDGKELKQAATALALGNETLSGPVARITKDIKVEPRKPFDAPNWLRSDRPVNFGELVPARELNVAGYQPSPIRINLRMPPGLFGWNSKGIPVDLKYRYTPRPGAQQSILEVTAGQQLVRSISLDNEHSNVVSRMLSTPIAEGSANILVPTYLLPPLADLQFRYTYEYTKLGECQNSIIDNAFSAIDPSSTIDISQLPKYAAMPDLSLFAEAGFPFTRLADLSQTAVIMPDYATGTDVAAYLNLLGSMGESTGYPAIGVTVAHAAQVQHLADKDLLVLGTADNQPLLKTWSDVLPNGMTSAERQFSLSGWFSGVASWLSPDPRERERKADASFSYDGSGPLGTLSGVASPLKSGRSVVVVSGSDAKGLTAAVKAVQVNEMNLEQASGSKERIAGSLTLIQNGQARTVMDEQTYYVGSLPLWLNLQWFFAHNPLLLVGALLVGALVIAMLLYVSLRARAQRRLGD
jgi:hypothetical protein